MLNRSLETVDLYAQLPQTNTNKYVIQLIIIHLVIITNMYLNDAGDPHLSKISSMPLCKTCPGCGGMVHNRKVSCSCGHVLLQNVVSLVYIRKVKCYCGHVFVAKHNKHLLTPNIKHTLRRSRAIETDETLQIVDQLTKS